MLDWQDFAVVFHAKRDYTFDNKTVESILKHRKELGGLLFFDRIWHSIGLKNAVRAYPPKSNKDLKDVWEKIANSNVAEEKRLALLFYILKDCRHLSGADSNFARRTYLPPKYQLLVAGLWELDHCQFSRALEHLTDPSLTPDFADDILLILLQHPKCDTNLALGYYIAVAPPLKDQNALEAYFGLLSETSVVEAYQFAQRQDDLRHQALFERLIVSVLRERPGDARAERATLLVGLPLTSQEEAWFEDCLLHGVASKLPGAKDSVLVRRVARGQKATHPSALHRLTGDTIAGVNWDSVKASVADATPI